MKAAEIQEYAPPIFLGHAKLTRYYYDQCQQWRGPQPQQPAVEQGRFLILSGQQWYKAGTPVTNKTQRRVSVLMFLIPELPS